MGKFVLYIEYKVRAFLPLIVEPPRERTFMSDDKLRTTFKHKDKKHSYTYKAESDYFFKLSDGNKDWILSFNEIFYNSSTKDEYVEVLRVRAPWLDLDAPDFIFGCDGQTTRQASTREKHGYRRDSMNASAAMVQAGFTRPTKVKEKKCLQCKEVKKIKEYYFTDARYGVKCKECLKQYRKDRYNKKKTTLKEEK